MKKFLSICCVAVLLIAVLSGCNAPSAEQSEPPIFTNTPIATETPTIPEITADELEAQFQLIYENCGSSASQDAAQLTLELAALEEKAGADKKAWPKDYETQYKTWRASIIEERAALLREKYEEIIAEREHYTSALYGDFVEFQPYQPIRDAIPGLFYANYIDFDNDGTQELILLTWPEIGDDTVAILEVYGEDNGHAFKWFEQDIASLTVLGTDLQLVTNDGQTYLQAFGEENHAEYSASEYYFYGMKDGRFTLVNWLTDSYFVEDVFSETSPTETHYRSMNSDGSYTELTADQYQAILNKFNAGQSIAHVSIYNEPLVDDTGVLPPIQRTPAKVEVNGQLLDLGTAPYAYGGNLMAPLRNVLEAMGVSVYANSDVSVILASTNNDTLTIANREFYRNVIDKREEWTWEYGNYKCSFNGSEFVDIAVQISEGKLFGPLQIITPLFGAKVEWDSETKTIHITGSVPNSIQMEQSGLQNMVNFGLDEATNTNPQ